MSKTTTLPFTSNASLMLLSQLLLSGGEHVSSTVLTISRDRFEDMCRVARCHHVVMRAMKVRRHGNQIAGPLATWVAISICSPTRNPSLSLS
jgi:hypothetical protein